MEKILCAAIWYKDEKPYLHQPKNIKSGYVMCGRRHRNIIALNKQLTGKNTYLSNSVQGFITSKDRFVDRVEGNEIAISAAQVFGNMQGDELISEDLY
jgi:hypothetical protein